MKLSFLMICFYLYCFLLAYIQPATSGAYQVHKPGQNLQASPQLQLALSVADRRYCSTTNLRLKLRLVFTNIGNMPIVLDRQSSTVGNYKVSRTPEDAANNKYEADVIIDYSLLHIFRFDLPSESKFVILKPKESYETETELDIPFIYDGTASTNDDLHAGSHVLQIKVWTWYYPQSAEEWRVRWQAKGFLWSDAVTSLPMQFTLEKHPRLAKC